MQLSVELRAGDAEAFKGGAVVATTLVVRGAVLMLNSRIWEYIPRLTERRRVSWLTVEASLAWRRRGMT